MDVEGRWKEEVKGEVRMFLNFKIASFRVRLRGFNLNSKLTPQHNPQALTNFPI